MRKVLYSVCVCISMEQKTGRDDLEKKKKEIYTNLKRANSKFNVLSRYQGIYKSITIKSLNAYC